MRLTPVGCSGSGPGRDGAASCYLVQAGGTTLVLDAGPGSLADLRRVVRLPDVDAVVLSHLHPDHCLELCAWHVAARYGDAGRAGPLPVLAPEGAEQRLAAAYASPPEPLTSFAFADLQPAQTVGGVRIAAARAAHPPPAFAVRLEQGGRSLVYTGDTGPSPEVEALAHGADLLLAEAGTDTPASGLHLTGREAGEMAARAGVRRLVLTHVPTWGDPVRALAGAHEAYAGPVSLARRGLVLQV